VKRLAACLLAITILSAGPAAACSNPPEPDFVARLDAASSVFVVRLVSLADVAPDSREIVGEIELTYALMGEPAFRRITFDDSHCGGLRPVVGRYFLVATTQAGEQLSLRAGDDAIIDLSRHHSTASPPKLDRGHLMWHVANYLEGIPFPESVPRILNFSVLFSLPPPPPPTEP
jgi:hypothetical protein